jgi:rhodanese-related sulfurtransferase
MKAMRQIRVHDLAETPDAYVVDVREEHEYRAGHIPGAVSMPMSLLTAKYRELPVDRTLYLVCEVGARSGQATQALESGGWDVVNVTGGTTAWTNAGFPVET